MNCKSARKLIPAGLDGELGSRNSELLLSHLAACSPCREEAAALKRASDALGSLPGIEPAFTMADIRERAARRRGWNPLLAWLPPVSRLAATAMAVAAVALGSASGVYYGSHEVAGSRPPVSVTAEGLASSLGLDAFDNGLDGALHFADASIEASGEVTQ